MWVSFGPYVSVLSSFALIFLRKGDSWLLYLRLISVLDVDITPLNPLQPLPFPILSFAYIFQSRILIYAGSNIYMRQQKRNSPLEDYGYLVERYQYQ